MITKGRRLAELMGYKVEKILEGRQAGFWVLLKPDGTKWMSGFSSEKRALDSGPMYDEDLNALAAVWRELKERALWDEFWLVYVTGRRVTTDQYATPLKIEALMVYYFLTDLEGQVEAAVKVLEETSNEHI